MGSVVLGILLFGPPILLVSKTLGIALVRSLGIAFVFGAVMGLLISAADTNGVPPPALIWVLWASWDMAIFGGIGALIAAQKQRSRAEGMILGSVLAIVGWIIIALLPTGTQQVAEAGQRKCPFCAEFIRAEAIVCRHCGRDIAPATT